MGHWRITGASGPARSFGTRSKADRGGPEIDRDHFGFAFPGVVVRGKEPPHGCLFDF